MNYFRTAILLAAMTALFMGVGFAIGGQQGMVIAFFVALAMNIFTYWNSDKMVLRMQGAQLVDERAAPELFALTRQLVENAGLPMPKLYVMRNPQPNAFATGRNPDNAAVAVTTGLLERLSQEEVAGVVAHELAHIKNRDILIMTMTATLAGAISLLANFGMFFGGNRNNGGIGVLGTLAMVILAPLSAAVVQMAISRNREYKADQLGAEICQRPLWLASALQQLQSEVKKIPNAAAERNPSMAHMFIVNPLSGERMDNLFSTHPNTENRVAALNELAREMGQDGRRGSIAEAQGGPWGR